MDPLSIVAQHVVFGVRLDGFAELIRMPLHFREQAISFGLNIEVGENADRQKDRQYDTEGQLKAYFPTEHISPATDSSASYSPASRDRLMATTYPHGTPCRRVPRRRSRKPFQECLSM